MTLQELKETGQRLFKARQYAEAVPLLKSAAEALQKDETLWQELVLAASWTGQHEQAVEFAKQAIRQHPRSDWLWRQLGNELTVCDRLEEADKALSNARSLNPDTEWLWRYYAALHKKRKNVEKEIEAWENLRTFGAANSNDLNSLGIAYHDHKNFAKALEFYRLSAATEPSVAPLFNMGLVFNDPEVSQDADAADAYRRALDLTPDYEKAKERLDVTIRKLEPLAERARTAAAGLVQSGELFQFYVSPFEVLQLEQVETLEELDVKTIQRAKKRLLQEIDLNDGKVSWLGDYPLEKSRALAMEDELHDETKRVYHWAVFCNKRLLRFLTRGDIGHFLYSDDYFPRESLELLDKQSGFRAFLSKPFARQYNAMLTRAIERRLLPVVEVLFDGRRWVESEDDDVCFEGAYKRVADLVEAMRSKANDGEKRKLSLREVEDFLQQNSLPELFNLFPTAFASAQRDFMNEIRSLAISCFNEHGDADLSKGVLNLCKGFTTRSVELAKRLEADFKAIEQLIAEEKKQLAEDRKHSFSGWISQNEALQIEKASITYRGVSMSASDVESIRWGIFVKNVNGMQSQTFSLVVRSARTTFSVKWDKYDLFATVKRFFLRPGKGQPKPDETRDDKGRSAKDYAKAAESFERDGDREMAEFARRRAEKLNALAHEAAQKVREVVPIMQLPREEQDLHFQMMIGAVLHHLLPPLMANILGRLHAGQSVVIGPCTLFQDGIFFSNGIIFSEDHHLPWQDVKTQIQSGQIYVYSRTNPEAQVSMSTIDTDNAFILQFVCDAMRKKSS